MLRKPAVAGQFYPGDAKQMNALIDTFTPRQDSGRLAALAIIAPHAGYVYSGRVAAETFAHAIIPEIRKKTPRLVYQPFCLAILRFLRIHHLMTCQTTSQSRVLFSLDKYSHFF